MRTPIVWSVLCAVAARSALAQCDPLWARYDGTAPQPEGSAGVQWDPVAGSLIFLRSDQALFEWTGAGWAAGTTITGTTINFRHGCWDPDRQRIVVPCTSGVLLEWNPATHAFDTRPGSSGITGYVEGLAYDARRHRLVMVTTQFDADQLLSLSEETPSGWAPAAMPRFSRWYVDGLVYDPLLDQVMLLGGDTQSPPIQYVPMRLFAYKPAAAPGAGQWTRLPLAETPSLEGCSVVLDPRHGLTVIGGYERYRDFRIDGLGERDHFNATNPYLRVYNPAAGNLFSTGFEQLPTAWCPLANCSNPSAARFGAAIARHPDDGRLVVVGGTIDGYTFTPDDGWVHHQQQWADTLFTTARPAWPTFTLQPQDRAYCTTAPGGTASGRLQALVAPCGGGAAQFRWYRWDPALETYTPAPGDNQNAFYPTDDVLHASDSGTYRLLAWNPQGLTWSDPAILTVTDPPALAGPVDWSPDACPGGVAVITPPAILGTSPTISLQKQVPGSNVWNDVAQTTPGRPFVLYGLRAEDSGLYRVHAANACGTSDSPEHRLQVGASIESPITAIGTIAPCGSVLLSPLLGTVHGRGDLQFRWYKDGAPLADDDHRSGSDTAFLAISSLGYADSGDYELRVTDAECGTTTARGVRFDLPEPPVEYLFRDPEGPRPSPRSNHAMAFDAARGVTVLYGGIGPGPAGPDVILADTWEFDGSRWTQRTPTHNPGPVHAHAMAFDAARGRVLLFGGFHHATCPQCNPRAEVWEWDGQDWTLRSAAGPADSLAAWPAWCFDTAASRLILYTGSNPGGSLYQGETWAFDPATAGWQRLATSGPGTGYGAPAMYYDPVRNQRVLYVHGSIPPDVSPPVPAVWTWTGSAWALTDWDPSGSWPYNQQAFPWCPTATNTWIYNPLRRGGESGLMTVIPNGGGGYFNGTYTTSGAAGSTLRRAIDNGFGVAGGAEVWDSRRNCAVIFGGRDLYPGHDHYNRPTGLHAERHFANAPVILDEPLDTSISPGSPLTFRVVAAGAPTLAWQWRRNGVPLADNARTTGSHGPTLRIAGASAADAGVYDCTLTNSCGSTTSRAASASGGCPGDFNRDGFMDFFDYDDFVGCFESGACPPGTSADFNGDGFVDFFDYDDFVGAFESGC